MAESPTDLIEQFLIDNTKIGRANFFASEIVASALADYEIIPRAEYEAYEAALEAARLLEVAEHFHANCEECDGEIEMEECGECFPYADDARLKRREAIVKAHAAGLIDDAALRSAGIETEGEGTP